LSEISICRFTYHGFRYVSLFDLHHLTSDDIECRVIHSETTLKGHFVSSNPIINNIQHNIQWGQLSNLMAWPSDKLALFFINSYMCLLFLFDF